MTLQEAQQVLNRYNFCSGGKELFPTDAKLLTPNQLKQLEYYYTQAQYLSDLKKTEVRLEKQLTALRN